MPPTSVYGHHHYSGFAIEIGQRLYRHRVNELLSRSTVDLRLAHAGEDAGRLVEHVDDAREELLTRILQPGRGDGWAGVVWGAFDGVSLGASAADVCWARRS